MEILRFRSPGRSLEARALLRRARPDASRETASRWLAEGALRRDGPGRGSGEPLRGPVAPGTACRLEAPGSSPPPAVPAAGALRVLVAGWPWLAGRGRLAGRAFDFAREEQRRGVAALRVEAGEDGAEALLDWLAEAGAPALGDARRGGVLVEGGLRLCAADAAEPPGFWPEELVFAPDAGSGEGALRVSAAALRALGRGHPWVLADAATDDPRAFPPGALVRLRGPRGEDGGLALADGDGPVVARRWSAPGVARPRDAASVEARVAAALARRRPWLDAADAPGGTDAFRLVHGEADGLPGLAVDRLGPRLRLLVTGRAALSFRERALAAVVRGLAPQLGPDPPALEVLYLSAAPPGEVQAVRAVGALGSAGSLAERWEVREGGLRLWVEAGLAAPTRPRPGFGLYLDQRDNRARLAARTRAGGRYANLFAHTGAFSATLLAAGAGEVVSVDLSAAYLAQLEENLALSALPAARHRSVRRDARRFLAELPAQERFDGIVLDPPTSAAAGRRFWSVRRDLVPLTCEALARLAPGGWLLLSRNDRHGRGRLAAAVREAAERAGVCLASLEPAPPSGDFPPLAGFPEGDPFEAVLATVGTAALRSSG